MTGILKHKIVSAYRRGEPVMGICQGHKVGTKTIYRLLDEFGIKRRGKGWRGDSAGHSRAGRAGGEKTSHDREHMATIGRAGGLAVSKDSDHMAAIGRLGGKKRPKP